MRTIPQLAPAAFSLANSSASSASSVCRSYAEDQRKRAARQVRDLVNIAKQGEHPDSVPVPSRRCSSV
jgi:hypothetical protein